MVGGFCERSIKHKQTKIPFDSVRRGARGPVRAHQLHRPKDGPDYNNLHLTNNNGQIYNC